MKHIYILFLTTILTATIVNAQLTDNFSDGNFNNNPTWSGDTNNYIVNPTFQFQLNAPAAAAVMYASTSSAAINNATWEFYVQFNFNPSSTNFAKVYLVADQSNLKNPLNGYFVKIGNTADEVSLYRQTGTTETMIIDGVNGRLNTVQVTVSVQVTRDNLGNWQLFSDTLGGTNFFLEGSVLDNNHTTSAHFGVVSTYTSTRSTLFFYDNFNVTGTGFIDNVPPTIDSLVVQSATNLDVHFNEPVNAATAQTLTNYSVNLGIGNPSVATRDAVDSSLVHLTFAAPFVANVGYNLTTINVEDTVNNAISSIITPFVFVVAVMPSIGDVIINEIFPDPTPQVGLPIEEFVELFNASSNTFNLNGWQFINSTTVKVLPNFILPPNGHVILCDVSDTALFSPFGSVIGIPTFTALTNSADSLTLTDNNNTVLDIIAYKDTWYQDVIKKDGGWTLERINPFNLCSNPSNWIASVASNGGTPGTQNSVFDPTPDAVAPQISNVTILSLTQILVTFSETMDSTSLFNSIITLNNGISITNVTIPSFPQSITLTHTPALDSSLIYILTINNGTDCAGNALNPSTFSFGIGTTPERFEVIINEIFPDPTPQVGIPTEEFIELFNTSTAAFNLNGWQFINTTTVKTLPNFLLPPNGYVILCDVSDTALFSPFGNVIGIPSITALTNSGDSLTLTDNNNNIIDIVAYQDTWYQDNNKKDGGWTLERINPINPCSNATNWIASVDVNGGTPGTQNSVFDPTPDAVAPKISNVTILSLTQIEVIFSETMDSTSLFNSTITINNSITITNVAISSFPQSIILTHTPALDSSLVYLLSISNGTDCAGNALNPSTFSFGIGKAPEKFEVIITELFADPEPSNGLPLADYLELYNTTNKIIDLTGSVLSDLTSSDVLNAGKILPGEYVIVCDNSFENQFSPFGKVITVNSMPSLNNTDDIITLLSPTNAFVHSVHYFDDWYKDANKTDGGWSLEMIDPNNPCGEEDNWAASTSFFGGSPGVQNTVFTSNLDNALPILLEANATSDSTVVLTFNEIIDFDALLSAVYIINNGINIASVSIIDNKNIQLNLSNTLVFQIKYTVTVTGAFDCVGNLIGANNFAIFALPEQGFKTDLIINEVLFNPFTGGSDFVEIYNNSNKFINLQNWYLANADNDTVSNKRVIIEKPRLVLPGEFVVLTINPGNVAMEYLNAKINTFIQMPSVPAYNDGEGTVVLVNNLNMVVDSFEYNEDMQFSLLNELNGVSLERIDYNRPTNEQTNWHSAAEAIGFATPGFENSQFQQINIGDDEIIITPNTFSPNNDGVDDVLSISYNFGEAGFVGNVMIYDAKGREVRNLINNELLASKGTFSWDGVNNDNEKARIGIYVVYVEVFKLDGTTKSFKKTAVLAGRFD